MTTIEVHLPRNLVNILREAEGVPPLPEKPLPWWRRLLTRLLKTTRAPR